MPKLTFYRQKRFDGGVRMGVEVDGETILEHFEPGEGERDPSLLWYVDLRCDGPGVPDDAVIPPQWLISRANVIKEGLSKLADQLRRVGADLDDYPLQWSEFPDLGDQVVMKIACSAVRRVEARDLANILDDIRDHWEDRIEAMIAEFADSPSGD